MKRLGTALHVVANRLMVKAEAGDEIPRPNTIVVDRNRARIGRVSDALGPVASPYIVVRPNRGLDVNVHVGKMLYVEDAPRRDGKWKR
ncbi:MAG: H/ACA RNA-protein complex component Gar1 [Methanosaeta sp. PtaB.Bin039]|nr:MAG: H/ACA RNA-protein complex component Gar1 [Methanosaeta sp. PtaB.Bin039]HOT07446.1 H/ACA ribonucleoprotein complex subunit GAR1 [Methanotrichaceae archaeon]HQF17405.1 H/ACA ribonucleoprotein complex subunit GAR1 [Methanotrichaceae archaeon]HQI91167.1 H/ACA ribonucleoprotein complex subunit GAR1 [Methanotrichaceae archaeon]HQJ29236.1 H/ACA ribonucleoprotein complex subunit GAR1 [Methanotrichaceae archaeon]